MAKIKIISNPYQKMTVFQCWDEALKQWHSIDADSNADSKLLCDELCVGFFPFKAKKIIDVIVSEYSVNGEKIEVIFEGTDDEYLELYSICSQDDYSASVTLSKSGRYLENARDILPDVIDIFKELSPLVAESVSDKDKIKRELEKFSDASNDVIPICVIGNYSSGKSTFINALIGYELLPSSDEPTTAKIYKISQSKQPDRATIKFEYDLKSVRIRFNPDSYKFLTDPEENLLAVKLSKILDGIAAEPIPIKLSKVLETINGFANHEKDEAISDLIEIETPFDNDGLWGKIWNNFVIFDTPGSNSASNIKHYQVLQTALEGLSNGLPIFVSEYDSLDSMDNDRLYQDINNMAELDNRFTMIIVNKADAASLKKTGLSDDDRDRILNLAIPRQLYSGGIYFVSSIMGLGSKNDENFIEEHNAEVFEDQKNKYTDSTSRFYKQLYRYNILPAQIKRKYDMLSERHKNLLYANSGLYSVEQAIETFASIYSHYNKCQQSKLFLGKVIQITFDEITDAKQKKEAYRERIHANLEKEKKDLINRLETHSTEAETGYQQDYAAAMDEFVKAATTTYESSELADLEASYRQAKAEEKDIEGRREDVRESTKSFVDNLGRNFANTFRERNLSALKKIGADFTEGFKDIIDNYNELTETRKDAEQASSDALIETVRNVFTTNFSGAQVFLEKTSREYWAARTEQLKLALSQIVTNSSALTDEKRTELSGIILEYQKLVFDTKAEAIFDKTAFLYRFFGDTNRLKIEKLARKYNEEMQKQVLEIYHSFERSHANSFDAWMSSLLDTIIGNIVEFSPQLHEQAEIIREETARISELESRMIKLNDYTEQIRRMMDWKES
ncbi:MAG: hypothetical protein HFF49_00300 [Lawsonibacter sp.]|jgi:GTPase Era involved in 16S rRNA processing|nr:hypothetical protein [Lawsonibacter sp.]